MIVQFDERIVHELEDYDKKMNEKGDLLTDEKLTEYYTYLSQQVWTRQAQKPRWRCLAGNHVWSWQQRQSYVLVRIQRR